MVSKHVSWFQPNYTATCNDADGHLDINDATVLFFGDRRYGDRRCVLSFKKSWHVNDYSSSLRNIEIMYNLECPNQLT